jgi:hypothetical protein
LTKVFCFFFEKKKQKTFDCLAVAKNPSPALAGEGGARREAVGG